jgi:ketosteroid isomerase-like protein
MKRLALVLLAALAAAPLAHARADDKKATKDDQATQDVMKANQALTDAIAKGDGNTFHRLTSDDYILTSSIGSVWDKQKNEDALKEGTLKFDRMSDEETKATLYDNTAVVTGLSNIKGKYKDHEFDDSYRWTRVWVRRDAKWLCVAEQMSRVQQPPDAKPPDAKPK